MDILHRVMELIGKFQPFNRDNGKVLPAVLGALGGLPAQDHLRVVHKVAVDGKPIFILPQVYPFRLDGKGTVPLL